MDYSKMAYSKMDLDFDRKLKMDIDPNLEKAFAHYCEVAMILNCCKEDKVKLYGLEKQATYGKVMIVRPGLHNRNDPKEWEAWNAQGDKPKVKAMSEFCNRVTELAAAEAEEVAKAAAGGGKADWNLEKAFAHYCEVASKLNCCKEEKVKLYGLEKQATYGKVMIVRPGLHNRNDPKEWEAWNAQGDKPKVKAMSEFCKRVTELVAAEVPGKGPAGW